MLALVVATGFEARAWQPEKSIELIVMTGEGTRLDRLARSLKRIVEGKGFATAELKIVNDDRDGGGRALERLKSASGDPDVLLLTAAAYLHLPLKRTDLEIDIRDFTPIAGLAEDAYLVWVAEAGSVRSIAGLKAAVNGSDPVMRRHGRLPGETEEAFASLVLLRKFGFVGENVLYGDSRSRSKDIVRGQIGWAIAPLGEQVGFWKSGKSRPLLNFASPGWGEGVLRETPSLAESDADGAAVIALPRAVVAPIRISVEAQTYYEGLFERVSKAPAWQEFVRANHLTPAWSTGLELTKTLVTYRDGYRTLLKEIAEID